MRAVIIEKPGGPGVLKMVELDNPKIEHDQILIRVAAVGVNRGDLYFRLLGVTHPVTGAKYCPGYKCSGIIKAVGSSVTEWKVGDKVCALLDGGGYAEEVAVSASLVLPVPSNVSLTHAASLPEAAWNAWHILSVADLGPGKILLIRWCCGDIGLFVLQMAKRRGIRVHVIAETDEQLDFYEHYGADICIKSSNVSENPTRLWINPGEVSGVDVVLDSWAINLEKDIKFLNVWGKVIFVDLHGPPWGILKIQAAMKKQAKIQVLTRWLKKLHWRGSIINSLKREVWPEIENGLLQPVVYKTFELSEAAAAHRHMEHMDYSQNVFSFIASIGPWLESYACTSKVAAHVMGKILLTLDHENS